MTNTTQSNNLYPIANGTTSSNPFVDVFAPRDPNSNDINYPTQKKWLNTTNNNFWMLEGFVSSNGVVTANWIQLGGGLAVEKIIVDAFTPPGTNPVVSLAGEITVTGGQVAAGTTSNVIQTDSVTPNTYTIQIQRSQAVASSTIGDNGVSHFNSAEFTVDANGFVSAGGSIATSYVENSGTAVAAFGILNVLGGTGITTTGSGNTITINNTETAFYYTNVTYIQSPYTVLAADYYISVDCSGGAVELLFPNAPTADRLWIIKDRTGNAAPNNITLSTPGATITFDGLVTYTMNSNYQATQLLANATPTYEVF